jgi:hypothetical protein
MTAVHFSGLKDTFQEAYLWASKQSEGKSVKSLTANFDEEHGKWQGVVTFNVKMSEQA